MAKKQYVVCVNNSDYPASLELRKIYEVLPDPQAKKLGQVRVVDESGEDYLYPHDRFMEITISKSIQDAFSSAA